MHQLAKLLMTISILESPDSLVPLAISQSLGSLFSHHLTQTRTSLQDYSLIQALKADVRDNMVLHLIQERAMLTVNQALTDENITCVWIGTKALGYTVYTEAHLRVTDRLECLISSDDMPATLKILESLNYYQANSYPYANSTIQLRQRQNPQLQLVLHEHVKGYSGRVIFPDESLAQWVNASLAFELKGQTLHTLETERHFLYLCVQGFLQDGQSYIGLSDLLDLHLLLVGGDLDWNQLISEAVDLQLTYLVTFALLVVQEYFATPISSSVFDALQKQNRADQFMRRIVLNNHNDSKDESTRQYMKQLTLPEKAKTVGHIIFPPKRYIRQRYSIRAKRATAPYYAYRILTYLAKMPFVIIGSIFSRLKQAYQNRG